MSLSLNRCCQRIVHLIERPGIRHRWIKRGKDPVVAKTLAQKVQEWNVEAKDPELHYKVDIGYSYSRPSRKAVLSERLQHRKSIKNNIDLQKAALNRNYLLKISKLVNERGILILVKVSIDAVTKEWMQSNGPFQIQKIAEYYGVYEDLFGEAYFVPVKSLDIQYTLQVDAENDVIVPVHRGSLIKPHEAVHKPIVRYTSKEDELFTLMMTTPDCHLTEEKGEYIHWMVGNIPGSNIEKGQEICDYIQPFPLRGIGFCRYVFVLFKQDKKLNFSQYQRELPCKNLAARTFSTYDFYREFQDNMTPAGLAFFQSNWDQTLTEFFHHVLEMKEPVYEYDFPEATLPEQVWFPHREPFDKYLDQYKDPKELQKELLIEKLKERHPFIPPPKPPKYPMAYLIPHSTPTWLRDQIQQRRMKEGKWKYM